MATYVLRVGQRAHQPVAVELGLLTIGRGKLATKVNGLSPEVIGRIVGVAIITVDPIEESKISFTFLIYITAQYES